MGLYLPWLGVRGSEEGGRPATTISETLPAALLLGRSEGVDIGPTRLAANQLRTRAVEPSFQSGMKQTDRW